MTLLLQDHVQGWVIPTGDPILLWAPVELQVIHKSLTSHTVMHDGKWIYLGLLPGSDFSPLPSSRVDYMSLSPPDKLRLWTEQLKYVHDPEISVVNIVELGLIYSVRAVERGVEVVMTLTSPACGMGPALILQIKDLLCLFSDIEKVDVELTFTPKWSRKMIHPLAQLKLDLL